MVLTQCLSRFDRAERRSPSPDILPDVTLTANVNGSQSLAEMGPRLELSPPMPFRTKSEVRSISPVALADCLPMTEQTHAKACNVPLPVEVKVLIVDDNAINRRLLAAFMKRRKINFKEAKDGLQALNAVQEAEGTFDTILMDISMPVMDGMTSTRLIREHENKMGLNTAHIIALTGLTSASAKLEAWTSGVDDFLTKPVDFEKLEALMKAGRAEEGTGFWGDQDRKEPARKPEEGMKETVPT